jgi:hypothetical protein
MMNRNYSLSLSRIALVLATGCAFLLPVSAPAPTVDIIITQFYVGFSQSIGNPDIRGPAALNIPSQTPDGNFQGFITILGNTYAVTGKVDANGNLKFSSGRGGGVTGTGKWQDLTRGGALIFGSYKLASGDQGQVNFLREFTQPPDPDMPPDIAGSWRGTFESSLSLMRGTVEWDVQQDLTETGAPGTGFTGQERITSTPAIQLYQFAGTIDAHGNFVRIGVSAQGFVIEGGKLESGELTGQSCLDFALGGMEVRTYRISTSVLP